MLLLTPNILQIWLMPVPVRRIVMRASTWPSLSALGLALGPVALAGFAAGIILLGVANYLVFAGAAMRALPLIHATLIIYAVAIIAAAVL